MVGRVHEENLSSQRVVRLVLEGEKTVDQPQKCDRREERGHFQASGQLIFFGLIKGFTLRDQASNSLNFFIRFPKICSELIKHVALYTNFVCWY